MTANHRVRPPRRTITLTLPFRMFLLAVAVFAAVIGWVLFLVIDANASLNHYVKNAHAQRLVNQKDTQEQIRDLACLVVKPFPNSAGPLIQEIRDKYHCPPFNPADAPRKTASTSPARAAAQPKPGPTTGHGAVVADGRVSVPQQIRTVHVTQPSRTHAAPSPSKQAPNPTPKPSPNPTSSRITPPILDLGNSSCVVSALGICVLKG